MNNNLQLLETLKIKANISKSFLSYIESIMLFSSVTSTNDHLDHKQLTETAPFQFCVSEHQSAARGRLGRPWISPFAENIYFSCAWKIEKPLRELNGLSLLVGLACVKALENYGFSFPIKLKWPNDVIYQGKKIGGILVETATENNNHTLVTIGIGLNVNSLEDSLKNAQQACTSLRLIDQNIHDRNCIISHLINSLLSHLLEFEKNGFEKFYQTWMMYDYFLHQQVRIIQGNKTIHGISRGINQQGCLLLEDSNGTIHVYSGGDISLRG